MNCTRAEFQKIISSARFDRMGLLRQDDGGEAATKLVKYALKLNAVLVWAIEDYAARGFPSDTREAATLGLALLHAAPEEFTVAGCDCNPAHNLPCPHREAWRQQLLAKAVAP